MSRRHYLRTIKSEIKTIHIFVLQNNSVHSVLASLIELLPFFSPLWNALFFGKWFRGKNYREETTFVCGQPRGRLASHPAPGTSCEARTFGRGPMKRFDKCKALATKSLFENVPLCCCQGPRPTIHSTPLQYSALPHIKYSLPNKTPHLQGLILKANPKTPFLGGQRKWPKKEKLRDLIK